MHGGGKLASELCRQLDIKVVMDKGRRVTDLMTLRVAVMVYAGWINKNLVASLLSRGCRALGLSGADGGCIMAEKRKPEPVDYGFAGDLRGGSVDTLFIQNLLEKGLVPVFRPSPVILPGNCSTQTQIPLPRLWPLLSEATTRSGCGLYSTGMGFVAPGRKSPCRC